MSRRLDPATRPSRISLLGRIAIVALLTLSFCSGIAVWRGQIVQSDQLIPVPWLRAAVILHGSLFPLSCMLFGALAAQHIRIGWQLRANLASGFLMEAIFAGLIITGAGLYYVGAAEWRERLIWTHRVLGLLWPLSLGLHWVMAIRWAKKVSTS